MALTVSKRPLVSPAAKAVTARPAASAPRAVVVKPSESAKPAAISPAAFTPPVIVDIIWQSMKSGVGLVNLVWMVGPSAFRNVRDLTNGKISVGRGAGNILADTAVNVGKGIAAGAAVQALQIAVGPALGLLPVAALPFAGIAVGIGGLLATYWLLGKLVKKTAVDTKLSNVLTRLFGGDKPAPAAG